MDVKAMAKSKRSHTQHNQPRKPHNHPPKPTSSTNNSSNLKKETREKNKVVHQKPSLPSNWDRYDDNVEEEGEFGQEIPVESVSKEAGGVAASTKVKKAVEEGVKPKSKGADFGSLIAQAKESKQQFMYSPSFGDTVDDFYQGLAPMLDVKSKGIPSWDRDDDFLLENEATSEEAPNFSLDLKVLAEELAKVDLANRLFIEPDLLPPELRGPDANEVDNQVLEKRIKTFETFEELYAIYLADEKIAENEDSNKEGIISSSIDASDSKPRDMPHPSQMTEQYMESRLDNLGSEVNHVTDQDSMPKFRDLGFFDASEVPRADHVSKQDMTPSSKFVADVAEAELDMLLDSFTEAKFSDSPATSMSQQGISMSNLKGNSVTHQAPMPYSRDVSRPAQIISSLDDELDNLLDASNLNKKRDLFQSIEVKGGSANYGPTRGAPLQHSPEGPSRPAFPVSSCSLDDELDNLLEETSKPNQLKIDSIVFPSSSSSSSMDPGLKRKVVDDFDSWLDSL